MSHFIDQVATSHSITRTAGELGMFNEQSMMNVYRHALQDYIMQSLANGVMIMPTMAAQIGFTLAFMLATESLVVENESPNAYSVINTIGTQIKGEFMEGK